MFELESIGSNCKSGACPTLYRSQDGRYFIQGFRVSSEVRASIDLPSDDDIVEISREFLETVIASVK